MKFKPVARLLRVFRAQSSGRPANRSEALKACSSYFERGLVRMIIQSAAVPPRRDQEDLRPPYTLPSATLNSQQNGSIEGNQFQKMLRPGETPIISSPIPFSKNVYIKWKNGTRAAILDSSARNHPGPLRTRILLAAHIPL